ncbi:M20/M25/M40 family metallo-hydrolase [Robiginitalea sp. SC105]|uniref:M20/M25/M40 family metallo-hydrolase n=1 Tax=Robiginitalea sp. SC105 TaxID=2762332 RepID=UPI00163A70E4|nr:M20/M25/M40 family metallo-hydrolase [Robiginitalea sp. SC105]MBC2839695.1 M20/M25/M40 family metallo-hydrolase [Robiginitalea sp. SC105]
MKKMHLLLLLLACQGLQAQKLTRTERRIVATVSEQAPEAVDFLEKVVNINSGTLNLEGVRKVGSVFGEAFREIGFATRWVAMPDSMNRAGHFFAEIQGGTGKRLLLIGHLDTVFEEDSPFQTFERINDSTAHAPGGNDMKGGDVVVLYALKALAEQDLLGDAQIIVAFTGDEESTGKPLDISRYDLIEAAKRSDVALGFETATGFDKATVARRGASGWKVEATGKRAHSSGVFSERTGAGAIFELSRILNGFYEEVRGEEYLTFNPGSVAGGTFVEYDEKSGNTRVFGKSNVVAQTAVAQGGLRFISEEQKENARARMREIVSRHLPQTDAKISFTDAYPAMGPKPENLELLEKLSAVSRDLGQGPVTAYDPGRRGAADVSFVARYVACLDGLGTMGSGAHTPQETVNFNTIEALTQRTALMIYRLIRETR